MRGGDDVVVAVVGGGVERGVEEEGEGEEDVVIDVRANLQGISLEELHHT